MIVSVKSRLLSLFVFGVLLTACASGPKVRADEGIPQSAPPDEASSQDDEPSTLEGEYTFTMNAVVDGLANMRVFDTMQSDWSGQFTVDSSGQIEGQGKFTYQTNIYSEDDERCGYVWEETGEFTFTFGGSVRLDGDAIPLKILSPQLKSSITGGATATCADPSPSNSNIPPNYISLHRGNLIAAIIQHIHTKLGSQLVVNEDLVTKVESVNYGIRVEYYFPPVPLTE
ncbi:MAG: hypothetical protein P8Z42_12255 [Anaerolineales bacterium]|jgi:hypothetical protein